MDSLVLAHLHIESTVEIGGRDVELDPIHIVAAVLSKSIDVQGCLLAMDIGVVLNHLTLNLALVIHNDFSAIFNVTLKEGQLLGFRGIGKIASGIRSGILSKGLTQRTIIVMDVHSANLIACSADSLVGSGGELPVTTM